MITFELLARLCSVCVDLGGLRFAPEINAKICDRLVELCIADPAGQAALCNELQQILADEGAAQEQRLRGALH
jgi:hypothetical protein